MLAFVDYLTYVNIHTGPNSAAHDGHTAKLKMAVLDEPDFAPLRAEVGM